MDLLDTIIDKIKTKYKGNLVCEDQRADLFVYLDGEETNIVSINTETIFFEDRNIKLIDADIHTLSYINHCI